MIEVHTFTVNGFAMIAIASLLVILTLSLGIVRVGAVALELTGLSKEIASFQAQSSFSGAGFTTSESAKSGGNAEENQRSSQ